MAKRRASVEAVEDLPEVPVDPEPRSIEGEVVHSVRLSGKEVQLVRDGGGRHWVTGIGGHPIACSSPELMRGVLDHSADGERF